MADHKVQPWAAQCPPPPPPSTPHALGCLPNANTHPPSAFHALGCPPLPTPICSPPSRIPHPPLSNLPPSTTYTHPVCITQPTPPGCSLHPGPPAAAHPPHLRSSCPLFTHPSPRPLAAPHELGCPSQPTLQAPLSVHPSAVTAPCMIPHPMTQTVHFPPPHQWNVPEADPHSPLPII
ncbi:uncharacterized protein [Narcine bancroftii]|uniref:uncharacterized protein n=1 Tax=Narcine bancroftii TaxID=1343680 RepID=UPI003831117D